MTVQDDLTGLPQKAGFDERLASSIDNGSPVSVALFDVDRFLQVNEDHGREAGDKTLVEITQAFQQSVSEASLYRIGGDEFAILLPGLEKEEAFLELEQARRSVEALESLSGIDPHPTVSIGVATYPDDGTTLQEVVRKADDALFRSKQSGRNKVALAREERKVPKTSHYTQGQLDRLSVLAGRQGVGEAELLREALDDLLKKYTS